MATKPIQTMSRSDKLRDLLKDWPHEDLGDDEADYAIAAMEEMDRRREKKREKEK